MSKELVKLVSNDNLVQQAGSGMLKVSGGALALGGVAWILPFVTYPWLLVMVVIGGLILKFSGNDD